MEKPSMSEPMLCGNGDGGGSVFVFSDPIRITLRLSPKEKNQRGTKAEGRKGRITGDRRSKKHCAQKTPFTLGAYQWFRAYGEGEKKRG